jgi:FkbM family methyltransferase
MVAGTFEVIPKGISMLSPAQNFRIRVKKLLKTLLKLLKTLLSRAGYTSYNDRPWGYSLKTDLKKLGFSPRKAQVILDIGANDGRWLASAYKIFPRATFHAFEPVPTTFETLCANVAKRARVRTYNSGFSSETKIISMQIYDNSRVNSMEIAKVQPGHRPLKTVSVQCATLDEWLDGLGLAINEIDFIKIDVEGHELHVLNGGAKMLRETRAAFLLIEAKSVLSSEVSGPGASLEQLSGFLSPFGYRLMVLYTDFVNLPTHPYYTNFDALFARVATGSPKK